MPPLVTAKAMTTWGRSGRSSLLCWLRLRKPGPSSASVSSSAISKYVVVVSRKIRSTSRFSKLATWKKTSSWMDSDRSEEHTSELQSRPHLVCRLLLEKKKKTKKQVDHKVKQDI